MKKKKVLMLFFRTPFPVDGGDKIRMAQMYDLLSDNHEVDIICLRDYGFEVAETKFIEKSKIISFKLSKTTSYFEVFKSLIFSKTPLQVAYFKSVRLKNWVMENEHKYDILFCNTIRMAQYLLKKPSGLKIIDFVDAISLNYNNAYKSHKWGLWKMIYAIDRKRTLLYEKKVLDEFDKSIIISENDKQYLLESIGLDKPIQVVPNYVELPEKTLLLEEYYLLFVGKMNYEPNVKAVLGFYNLVYKKLKKDNPYLHFYVVGSHPNKNIKQLSLNDSNVKVTGFVENLDVYYRKAMMVVAPMISGAGLQNKILEALAYSKCVLTTSIGCQGLMEIEKGMDILVEDDYEAMQQIVTKMLSNTEKRILIGANGRRYIERFFQKKAISNLLDKIINEEVQ